MALDPSTRHLGDVGKILKSVQDDLRNLRSSLIASGVVDGDGGGGGVVGGGGGNNHGGKKNIASISAVLDRAEADLKAKAEAVLSTALSAQFTTLPAIAREYTMSGDHHSGGGGMMGSGPYGGMEYAGGATARRPQSDPRPNRSRNNMTYFEGMERRRKAEMVSNPTTAAARAFLEERFGVAAPPPPKKRERAPKPKGRLILTKNAPSAVPLPRINRVDPLAPPPAISGRDVEKGIYDLVSRGLVPSHVDLTPAFIQAPAPVLCGPVQLHPWEEQFLKQETMMLGSFNTSNIKMDLISQSHLPSTQDRARFLEAAANSVPQTLKAVTLEVPQFAKRLPPSEKPFLPPPPPPSGAGGEEEFNIDDPRGYNELLDTFSLHQFIIRRGETLASTPEFQSFKRKYYAIWGRVHDVISLLEKMLSRFVVPIAYIDGNRVVQLSELDHRAPTVDDLLSCIVNLDQVLSVVQIPGRRFKGTNAKENAVIALQSCWRGHMVRKRCLTEQKLSLAAGVIQVFWRTILFKRETKARIQSKLERQQDEFKRMQQEFQEKWESIGLNRRVIVHIPSISRDEAQRISLEDFVLRENSQLARLAFLSDPLVDVIYVSPISLSPDVLQYYGKVLQIGQHHREHAQEAGPPEERYKIVFPENSSRFPHHFSLATVLKYSPRCLKRIRNFIKGREAFILPGYVGPDDVKVALSLKIPIFGPDPMVCAVYGSKSGAKRVFAAAEVNTPPSAFDLYEPNEIAASLSSLIFQQLDVKSWLLKVDDEFGGRGHAVFDASSLQFYEAMKKERDRNPQVWFEPAKQEGTIKRIMQEVMKLLPKSKIMRRDLFPDWEVFLETLCRVGCVIEAVPSDIRGCPSANIVVFPNGEIGLHSTHDQLWTNDFRFVGSAFPQLSCHHEAIRAAALSVGGALFEKKMFGYFGVDFVSFADAKGLPRIWGIDINMHITDSAVSFELFRFISGGEYDDRDGYLYVPLDDDDSDTRSVTTATPSLSDSVSVYALPAEGRSSSQRRHYVSCDMLYHSNLSSVQYHVFFNLCRLKGVHFDLQDRVGTAFCLVDSFASGVLGLFSAGKSRLLAARCLSEALDFIQSQLGISKNTSDRYLPHGSFKDAVHEIRRLTEKLALENADSSSGGGGGGRKGKGGATSMVPF